MLAARERVAKMTKFWYFFWVRLKVSSAWIILQNANREAERFTIRFEELTVSMIPKGLSDGIVITLCFTNLPT